MHKERKWHRKVQLNDNVYILGGLGAGFIRYNCGIYQMKFRNFVEIANAPRPRYLQGGFSLKQYGQVQIGGGAKDNIIGGEYKQLEIDFYNEALNEWHVCECELARDGEHSQGQNIADNSGLLFGYFKKGSLTPIKPPLTYWRTRN